MKVSKEELSVLTDIPSNVVPWVITQHEVGTLITLPGGEDLWVTNKPKEVYRYFHMKPPPFKLWDFILKITGITERRNRKYTALGEAKAHDPALKHLIKSRTPPRSIPGMPKRTNE